MYILGLTKLNFKLDASYAREHRVRNRDRRNTVASWGCVITVKIMAVKFRYSDKATKIWQNLPVDLKFPK